MELYIALYLTLGLIFTLVVDRIAKKHLPEEKQFTNPERFFTSLLWPLNLAIFLFHFIKEYLNLRK
jgi:hypothetical protein|tara:strand:- start:190 stop:387 length:198 start_codon:yes stop_codon:yes gene_type:complete